MLSCGHNNVITKDATFGTNDKKFLLFILMSFYVDCTETSKSKDVDIHVELEILLFDY
jgi:hypothetical protein